MSAAGPPRGAHSAPRGAAQRRKPQACGDVTRFTFPVRVYYEDTDAAGVVYYANYLRFMERARSEWLEALGFPLAAFERDHAVTFVVQRAEIAFLRPARLNDRLAVSVEARDRGACRVVLAQRVLREDVTLVDARITLACVHPPRWRPVRIPAPLARMLPTALPDTNRTPPE